MMLINWVQYPLSNSKLDTKDTHLSEICYAININQLQFAVSFLRIDLILEELFFHGRFHVRTRRNKSRITFYNLMRFLLHCKHLQFYFIK